MAFAPKKKQSARTARKFKEGEVVWNTYVHVKEKYKYDRDKYRHVSLVAYTGQDKK